MFIAKLVAEHKADWISLWVTRKKLGLSSTKNY